MAKKGIGKKLGWGLLIGIVLYVIYRAFKNNGGTIGKKTCYPLEEVHEASQKGTTWMSIIKNDPDNNPTVRPAGGTYKVGDKITIKNTELALNGTYPILAIWTDSDGNIGSFRVPTPKNYNFNYTRTQGTHDIDVDYFGVGEICL